MARPKPEAFNKVKIVAENRRARYDYFIEDKFEAGIALTGTEVKSLRFGEGTIADSYAEVKDNEVWLVNANIPNSAMATATITSRSGPQAVAQYARDQQTLWRGQPAGQNAGAALHLF